MSSSPKVTLKNNSVNNDNIDAKTNKILKVKSYQGWQEGDLAVRKGRLCTVTKIDFTTHPPSVTVKMADTDNEVGTEFEYLSKPTSEQLQAFSAASKNSTASEVKSEEKPDDTSDASNSADACDTSSDSEEESAHASETTRDEESVDMERNVPSQRMQRPGSNLNEFDGFDGYERYLRNLQRRRRLQELRELQQQQAQQEKLRAAREARAARAAQAAREAEKRRKLEEQAEQAHLLERLRQQGRMQQPRQHPRHHPRQQRQRMGRRRPVSMWDLFEYEPRYGYW